MGIMGHNKCIQLTQTMFQIVLVSTLVVVAVARIQSNAWQGQVLVMSTLQIIYYVSNHNHHSDRDWNPLHKWEVL